MAKFIARAPTPLGHVAVAGFGRVGLAGLVLVVAAMVVTMSGGAGLAGKVGSLFGLGSHARREPVTAVEIVGPVKAIVRSAQPLAAQRERLAARPRANARHPAARPPQQSPAPVSPRPEPALPPSGSPAPRPPPPAPSGNVQRAVDTVRDTAASAAPQAQPLLDQAAAAVVLTCGLIGSCP